MKILLAVPTAENIQPEVFKAIYDMSTDGHDVDFEFVRGYDCSLSRNKIVKAGIEGGYDYIMMVDSDTVIPKDALVHMLDPAADIVIGCCPRKNTKTRMSALCTWEDNPEGKGFHHSLTYDDLQGEERIALKGGGFACVLLRTEALNALSYPYFKYVMYGNGSVLSEDYYFCQAAARAGLRIYADPRVKCGHLARYYQYE